MKRTQLATNLAMAASPAFAYESLQGPTELLHWDKQKAYRGYTHDDQRDWDAVAAEIQELRGRVERLGNVNLDAIGEQDELAQRREFLKGQLADVTASQNQLHELIRRLNRESREMFLASFQAVRTHFQELFRKLFGGGRADLGARDHPLLRGHGAAGHRPRSVAVDGRHRRPVRDPASVSPQQDPRGRASRLGLPPGDRDRSGRGRVERGAERLSRQRRPPRQGHQDQGRLPLEQDGQVEQDEEP